MFTHIAISALQNDRLNRGYSLVLYVLPYLCTFAPRKSRLQPFSLLGTYASTLYIGKSLKPHYLSFIGFFSLTRYKSVFVSLQPFSCLIMYVSTIFRFWYVCSRLFPFSFSLAFCFTKNVCETLCKFPNIYAK